MEPFIAKNFVLQTTNKNVKNLYSFLMSLGLQAEMLSEHALKKVGEEIYELNQKKRDTYSSIALIKITKRNIGYINLVEYRSSSVEGGVNNDYLLEYLVPLEDIPLNLCWAKLKTVKQGLFRRKIVDIEWQGGTLTEPLNRDLTLRDSLLTEFRLGIPIEIEIAPEPIYQCARIETEGCVSVDMFDCLDRIAGYIPQHVTEVNSRPDTTLFQTKVEVKPKSGDAEVTDCYVTDRYVRIELKEPLQIPLFMVEDCDVPIPISYSVADIEKVRDSTVSLRYHDESGQRIELELTMDTWDASVLRNTLVHSYPCGISR